MDIPLIIHNEDKNSYTLFELLKYYFESIQIEYDKECHFSHKYVKKRKLLK